MMSPKKLLKVARKWAISTTIGRKKIALTRARVELNSLLTEKGHFGIYMADGSHFMSSSKMPKEKLGLSSDGPITMPCDVASMKYIILLIYRRMAKDIEKALLNSIAFFRCSVASLHNEYVGEVLVCG
ncbi:hypothetical protein BT93_E0571 [Corymbia citriodora subsp. variegata]|nr:hypothetical protein BT93_E0571 [Corymbia citriodora subsp. variegata]